MKIVMLGGWDRQKASGCQKEAEEAGKLLAEQGHILVSGGGTGVSEFVVSSYKKHKGKQYICYRPAQEYADKVGEELGPKPDKLICTKTDYPERNLIMIREGDAILALNGRLGTFAEIIEAVNDYNKKVSVIDFGDLAAWIRAIPEIHKRVLITKDIKEALKYLE